MVSVRVINSQSGNPSQYSAVGLGNFDGVYKATTDSNGEANFTSASSGEYEVYVDGKTMFKGHISGMKVIYI